MTAAPPERQLGRQLQLPVLLRRWTAQNWPACELQVEALLNLKLPVMAAPSLPRSLPTGLHCQPASHLV